MRGALFLGLHPPLVPDRDMEGRTVERRLDDADDREDQKQTPGDRPHAHPDRGSTALSGGCQRLRGALAQALDEPRLPARPLATHPGGARMTLWQILLRRMLTVFSAAGARARPEEA
jgi:hypothetical protein